MTRAERLQEYVISVHEVPMQWGVDDCTYWPAVWVEKELGITLPKANYSTQEQANLLISKSGGLEAIWESQMQSANLFESHGEPDLGDVGLIETRIAKSDENPLGLVGVIFAPPAGYWRGDIGAKPFPYRSIYRFWKLPHA